MLKISNLIKFANVVKNTFLKFVMFIICITIIQTKTACSQDNYTVSVAKDFGPHSLREIVANSPDGATIYFSKNLSGQVIELTRGEINLSKSLTIDASILQGGVRISGGRANRIFEVESGAAVVLDSLTIINGHANGDDGGGIFNSGSLILKHCTFAGNFSPRYGGGIFNDDGTLIVVQSTLTGNSAVGGAGIASVGDSVKLAMTNSTIANNTATFAGGILIRKGKLQLSYCSVSRNEGTHGTGGIVIDQGCAASLNNTIVANNRNDFATNSDPDIGGSGGSLELFGRNIIGVAWSDYTANRMPRGWPNVNNKQFIGSASHPGNPLLGLLGNNGGPTLTMMPQSNSPAINAAIGSGITNDQRGFPRPSLNSDIGSVQHDAGLSGNNIPAR